MTEREYKIASVHILYDMYSSSNWFGGVGMTRDRTSALLEEKNERLYLCLSAMTCGYAL